MQLGDQTRDQPHLKFGHSSVQRKRYGFEPEKARPEHRQPYHSARRETCGTIHNMS